MKIQTWIERCEYNNEWFEFDFIDEAFLKSQIKTYEETGDNDIEHYKWAAYVKILNEVDFTKKTKLKQFFQLIENDPNEHLFRGAVRELIWAGKISTRTQKDFPDSRAWKIKSILKYLKE